jgi:hypothetical protein
MKEKTPERPRNRAKAAAPSAASPPVVLTTAERYISEQLKAIYDAVVAEPIPNRIVQLLDRLERDAEK